MRFLAEAKSWNTNSFATTFNGSEFFVDLEQRLEVNLVVSRK